MKNLQGRSAIVTGAAHGIGRASAAALARRGVQVLLADIDEEAAALAANQIRSEGGEAQGVRCDVSQTDAFEALRRTALERFGVIDIVMNNVGLLSCGAPLDIPLSDWSRILDINLMSVVRSLHVFLPDMLERGEGHVVNTASTEGLFSYAYERLPYAASKAGIVALTEGLALYARPRGVGVTCLCPGPVSTQIGKTARTWTPDLPGRGPGPEYARLDPAVVGDIVVEAIEQDRIIVATHPEAYDTMARRARDPNGYMEALVAEVGSRSPRSK